ncbi:MAG: endonuclease Q family protein [Candidatus Berkelbacteria bacterium]|nr:endonuclease Q family protein [Candidatus Berkelbacteria bacterium]
MEPSTLSLWAKRKGILILGTSDFTHPGWLKELKEKLEPAEAGLFKPRDGLATRFILSSELSCIYTKNNKTRKIHLLILAPDFHTVEKINAQLAWSSNLNSDGRPILGMDAHDLAKLILETDERCMVIPAHIWTPWFSLFGSASGFDTTEECFEELSDKIYAFETGLSSDPEMNWKLSQLNNKTIISNSDAHSPSKLGREANVFEMDALSFDEISTIIKQNDKEKFKYTIEFYPEEGKYHFDGHRKCNISFTPAETKKNNNICSVCHKPLTIGVLNRVDSLADQEADKTGRVPFKSLIPLEEIMADVFNVGAKSKKVQDEYMRLTDVHPEFEILLDITQRGLEDLTTPEIAKGIIDAREGKVTRISGFDGVFGIISVTGRTERKEKVKAKKAEKQMGLF